MDLNTRAAQRPVRPARHTLPWADEHPRGPMSASLRDELRRRVRSGMYTSDAMALLLARILMERGEV